MSRSRKYEPQPEPEPELTQSMEGYRPRILDMPDPPFNVFVALPTRDMINAEFMYDFAKMTSVVGATLVADGIVEWSINMLQGTTIHTLRQEFAKMALEQGATHMLWLDTDHRFPPNAFFRLWNHRLPMVGVNYSTRKWPCEMITFKKIATTPDGANIKLYTLPESTGLESVDAMGFGMVLLDTNVLRALDPDEPWFKFDYDKVSKRDVGEDVYFCNLVRDAGYEIFIDHDLSKEIGHLGTFEYRADHANMWLEGDLADGTKQLLGPEDGSGDVARA